MSQDEAPSLLKLLGALFASALVTALGAGAVVAARLSGASFWPSLLVAGAAYALPALVVVALVRLAAASVHGGPAAARFRPVLVALALTASTTFVFALALGRVLKANTHHAGLGGTTFAIACAVLVLALVPLALRLAGAMPAWSTQNQSLLVFATVLAAGLMVAMAVVRVHRAVVAGGLDASAAVALDAACLLGFGIVASLARVGRFRVASLLAPPLFVGLVVVGLALTRSQPELSSAVGASAQLAGRCSAWLLR